MNTSKYNENWKYCLTENILEFVDFDAQLLIKDLPSCVSGTTEFIVEVVTIKDVNYSDYLLTLSVASLYSNISHDLGLEALDFLRKQTEEVWPNRFISELKQLILSILKKIKFENGFYEQQHDSAVCSPAYA